MTNREAERADQFLAEQDPEKKYVLLVDDEDAIRLLLRDVLEDQLVEIYEAENGAVALEYIKNRRIDLVVSDLRMPGMSGVDLLSEIRKRFPSLPVLIITGKPTLDAAVDCMKSGAIDFLTKPFDILEFRDMVKAALADNERLRKEQQESRRYHNLNKIGDYEIEDVLGEGTSGVVFHAKRDDKEYALKVFKFATITELRREEMRERFTRESAFLSNISHPNIVKVHDFGFSNDGIPFLVMDYLKGRSLKSHIQANDLTYEEKLRILRRVAVTLEFIHEQKIIHRDVKPDNLMIVADERRVVLTDFGIIRVPDSNLTMAANIMGSPAYLAPEGFASARVDHRCDIFSLGVVAYELLLGRRPFLAEDLFTMATIVQHELPPAPESLQPGFPEELAELLARALKKEPEKRFANCREFVLFFDYAIDPLHKPRPALPDSGSETDWRYPY